MTMGWFIFLYVVPLAVLWAALVIDLVRRDDIDLPKKLAWGVFTLLTAEFGAVAYIAMRPLRYPEDGAQPGEDNPRLERLITAATAGDERELAEARSEVLSSIRER